MLIPNSLNVNGVSFLFLFCFFMKKGTVSIAVMSFVVFMQVELSCVVLHNSLYCSIKGCVLICLMSCAVLWSVVHRCAVPCCALSCIVVQAATRFCVWSCCSAVLRYSRL